MDIRVLQDKIEKCKDMSLSDVNIEEVDDITSIKIDKRKSSNERLLDFLIKVKNPYIFKFNGRLIKIGFSNTSKTADDCLTNVLNSLYR